MQAALARHDEILRDAIAAHDGHIVKTTGDGVHAAFATATDAARAALGAQRSTRRPSPGARPAPSRADGYPHRPGGAARRRLLRHRAQPGGTADVDRARWAGRALARPPRNWSPTRSTPTPSSSTSASTSSAISPRRSVSSSSCTRNFDATFLPLQSLDAFRGNLPVQATSFVGRERGDHRDRSRAGEVSGGDDHRRRRCRQDPPRRAGRRRRAPELSRRRLDLRARRGERRRVVPPGRRREPRTCNRGPASRSTTRIAEFLRNKNRAARARQLRAPPRRGRRARHQADPTVRQRAHAGDEPRGPRRQRRAGLAAPVVDGRHVERPRRAHVLRRRPTLRRARARGEAGIRPRCRQLGGGRRDLSPARRDATRDRARRGSCRVDEPAGDRPAARRAVPAPHRRTAHRRRAPPHAPRNRRLVVLVARRA